MKTIILIVFLLFCAATQLTPLPKAAATPIPNADYLDLTAHELEAERAYQRTYGDKPAVTKPAAKPAVDPAQQLLIYKAAIEEGCAHASGTITKAQCDAIKRGEL